MVPTVTDDLALLQTANGVRLIQFTRDGVRVHATGIASCERHAWLDDSRVVLLTRRSGKQALSRQVSILSLAGGRVRTLLSIDTPILTADVTVLDGRIVIGGYSWGGCRVWWMHPDEDRCWRPLEMPIELGERKAVDALATNGTVLVAVDNIEQPKWMFRYVPMPGNPEWLSLDQVAEMRAHGSYESVLSASSGDTYFAVLSATIGAFGAGCHLSTYRFDDLSHGHTIETRCAPRDAPSRRWQFGMQGDALWVLGKQLCAAKIIRQPDRGGAGVNVIDGRAKQLLRSRNGFLWVLSRESGTLSPLGPHSSDEWPLTVADRR